MRIPPFHWWRTVFFLIPTISVCTIVLGTVSVLCSIFDQHGRLGHVCARVWSWLILATTGVEVRVHGLERVSRQTPYLFVSNHQSFYDIPIIFATLPFSLRIIAKDSLRTFPFLGWHLARTGHVLVNRRHPGTMVFRQVADLMSAGRSLLVFPEGTRSIDGDVGRFRGGIFLLAIRARLPIVPLAIVGSDAVMGKGRLITRPGRVDLILHEPIATDGLSIEPKELAEEVRAVVAKSVAGTRHQDTTSFRVWRSGVNECESISARN